MLHAHHRVARRLLAVALAVIAMVTVAAPAEAAPRTGRTAYARAIEPLAAYEPQTTCSPSAKRGMADLSRRILKAYPGSRSMGIVRACGVGGRSEHKEGRAFDWGVNVRSARDRAYVNNFAKWLLATDRHGNRYAMARRLGIQYIIWNKRIWGSYAGNAGWRPYSGASPHTDHVHISMTRAGADGRTSFWTKRPAKVKAAPIYKPPPKNLKPALRQPGAPRAIPGGPELEDESVWLDARSAPGVRTANALTAGEPYLIEVQGTWQYAKNASSTADAECSRTSSDWTWRRDRSVHPLDITSDHLDLYVDGVDLLASPYVDTGQQCDTGTHTYRWEYTPSRSGRVSFQLWDPGTYKDNSGGLNIRIIRAVAKAEMTWIVPAASTKGATSPGGVEAGATYLATVTGTFDAGGGVSGDAECSLGADGTWQNTSPFHLHIDNRDVVGTAAIRDAAGCDSQAHAYRFVVKPRSSKPINVRIGHTADAADNTGGLSVHLVKVGPVIGTESLTLNSAVASGATTARNYPAGQPVLITVGGTYTFGSGITADAECTSVSTDPVWRTYRAALVDADGSGLGDVTVNGRVPDWQPLGAWPGCELSHGYSVRFTPSSAGPLVFSVADTNFGDNAGSLSITVDPAGAPPAAPPVVRAPFGATTLAGGDALEDETVRLDATSATGAMTTGSFTAGQTYLIEVSGTWQYANDPAAVADAECSVSPSDATWRSRRSIHRLDSGSDHLDVYVDGVDLHSKPDTNTGDNCDIATHTYRWQFTPTRSGRMTFQLWDPVTYADNAGGLDLRIIRSAPKDEMQITVPASAAAGVSTPGAVQAGATYVATVTGTYNAGAGAVADGECSSAGGAAWQATRSPASSQTTADQFDLLIDRKDVSWGAVVRSADVAGCDLETHSYRYVLKPWVTRPLNLRVNDLTPGDNSGELAVRISKVVAVSGIESLTLDTTKYAGATTVRNYQAGKALDVTISGTYSFSGTVTADAECTITSTDSVWRTSRSDLVDATGRALGDATINGSTPDWRRAGGWNGCDATTHRYTKRYTPSTAGPLVFSVADTNFADNAGTLTISVQPA